MTIFAPVALHQIHGYSLFRDAQGRPYVIREWTSRKANKEGVREPQRHSCRLELEKDSFDGLGPQAVSVFFELDKAWKDWVDWHAAMKGA